MDALEDLVKGIFGSLQRGSFKEKPGQFQVYFTQGKSSRVKRILIVLSFSSFQRFYGSWCQRNSWPNWIRQDYVSSNFTNLS